MEFIILIMAITFLQIVKKDNQLFSIHDNEINFNINIGKENSQKKSNSTKKKIKK